MSADRPSPGAHPASPAPAGEWVSGLIDGQALPDDIEQACRQWRNNPDMRREWHVYQLIGDVIRSDELSSAPAKDAAFLQALRGRLAVEPVPLAPAPLPDVVREARADNRTRRWLMPAAAVAGFAVVGASVLALRPGAGGPTGWNEPIAAMQPSQPDALRRTVNAPTSASSPTFVLDGQVIRDARLDAYFEAHRGAAGPMPSAVPGGALRSVEILVPQR